MAQWNDCTILQCNPTEVEACWYILTEGHLDGGPPLQKWSDDVQRVIEGDAHWIIFDARKIKTYVDLGHGALVKIADDLRRAGGGAILLGMDERNRMTFKLLTIEHFFHFTETMEEALAIARAG